MNEDKSIDWKSMIEKLSSYSGTIKDFCKGFTCKIKRT